MTGDYQKICVTEFLARAVDIPVVDVRSPSEYSYGHIPGAKNIPLFSDYERDAVGKLYKAAGREAAILRGLEMCGPDLHSKLNDAVTLSRDGRLLVHCWRGGMRSEAMAWLFSLAGLECQILNGGYKSYRSHVLEYLGESRKYIILGGLTGSGKTDLLKYIGIKGEQFIDLEGLACHKGSAFGSLGQPPQPSSEHFANILTDKISKLESNNVIWLEDESKNIGSVFLPDNFYFNMQGSPVIALIADVKTRMPRLLEEYSEYEPEELKKSVMKISRRLGGDNTRESIESIDSGDFTRAIEITLTYYDKTYMYGLNRRPAGLIHYVYTDTSDTASNAEKILAEAKKIFR